MKCRIIGIRHSHGDYNGYKFDKFIFFCAQSLTGSDGAGLIVLDTKKTSCSTDKVLAVTGFKNIPEVFSLVDCDVEINFNYYGSLESISIC